MAINKKQIVVLSLKKFFFLIKNIRQVFWVLVYTLQLFSWMMDVRVEYAVEYPERKKLMNCSKALNRDK